MVFHRQYSVHIEYCGKTKLSKSFQKTTQHLTSVKDNDRLHCLSLVTAVILLVQMLTKYTQVIIYTLHNEESDIIKLIKFDILTVLQYSEHWTVSENNIVV